MFKLCVCYVTAPSAPQNVSATVVNATAIRVTWVLPRVYTEHIDEYSICYMWGHASSSAGRCHIKKKQYQDKNLVYNEVGRL